MGAVKQFFHDELEARYVGGLEDGPGDVELMEMDVIHSIDRFLAEAASKPECLRARWNDLALASDKLSHFLEQSKSQRAA